MKIENKTVMQKKLNTIRETIKVDEYYIGDIQHRMKGPYKHLGLITPLEMETMRPGYGKGELPKTYSDERHDIINYLYDNLKSFPRK